MLAVLWLLACLMLGFGLTRALKLPLFRFEIAPVVVLLGLFGGSWVTLLWSLILPYSFSLPLSTLSLVVLGAGLWWRGRGTAAFINRPLPGGRTAWMAWAVVTAAITLLLGHLLWTHSLLSQPDGIISGGSAWADFALHASVISHMSAANQLPLDLPVASGTWLTYPALIDWLSAVLVKGGWGLHLSLFVPGLALALSALQLVIGFAVRLFGKMSAALVGLGLFCLGGSAAGLGAAYTDWQTSGQSLIQFLMAPPLNYGAVDALNAHFNNFIADGLIPQRGFLLGLGLFGLIGSLLWTLRQDRHPHAHHYRLAVGVLLGLLPFAHPHTFVVLMLLVAALGLDSYLRKQNWLPWLTIISLALMVALPQILWQQLANSNGSGGHVSPGWMWQPGTNLLLYWWYNFGLVGPYFIGLLLFLLQQKWRPYLVWYAPFGLILLFTQLYSLQPFAFDSLKLINYVYLMACLFAGYGVVLAVKHSRWWLLVIAPVLLSVMLPGSLTLLHEANQRSMFASLNDIDLARWAYNHTPPTTIFLATDTPNQPVATLAGRSVVMGYRGWLYSYNLPYAEREAAVSAALVGLGGQPQVTRFGAQYLVVGASEGATWLVDRSAMDAAYTIVYRNPSWTVYRLATAN